MKFALVDGQRQKAQPNLSGNCSLCGHPTIAKCGEVRIWHWAHQGTRFCDPWWENKTEWHRKWQAEFPDAWQEIVHHGDDGAKHIADVKTDRDWVIEFQHSYLKPEERRSREGFYRKLIWVVDGMRREKDSAQLLRAVNEGVQVWEKLPFRRARSDDCVLLREWAGSNGPVFVDLGEQQPLWGLFATNANGPAYLAAYRRHDFIESLRGDETEKARQFDEHVNAIPKLIADYESYLRAAQTPRRDPLQIMPRRGRNQRRK